MKGIKAVNLRLSAALLLIIFPISSAHATLSPARDLVGTWQSPLQGKGFVLTGSAKTQNMSMSMTSSGDVKLVITSVVNNVAHGTITFSNMKEQVSVRISVPGVPPVSRTTNINLPGYSAPVTVQISSSRIVLPTLNMGGASVQMWGSFTSDLMMISEKMTSSAQGMSVIMNGQYRLIRKR